jgi:hypothetical protein
MSHALPGEALCAMPAPGSTQISEITFNYEMREIRESA